MKSYLILLTFIVLEVLTQTFCYQTSAEEYLDSNTEFGKPEIPILTDEPKIGSKNFNFEKLNKLIQKNKVKTIEQLVPLLPEDYRRYYTLMYKSDSRQHATFEKPRVIMFGPDSRFIIAFTGSADFEGGSILETIEWYEDSATFKFREISFDQKQQAEEPHVENNPTSCLQCHRGDPRPNWESYPLWPGSYGSNETTLSGSAEDEGYKLFLKQKSSNPRYFPLVEYKIGKTYIPSRYKFEIDSSKIPVNGVFNNYVGALNQKRILKRALDAEQGTLYSKFKYALAATAFQCTLIYDFGDDDEDNATKYSVEELIPPKIKFLQAIQETPQTFQDAVTEVWSAHTKSYNNVIEKVVKENPDYKISKIEPKSPRENRSDQYYLNGTYHYILSRMGINTDDYAMTFSSKTFSFLSFGDGINSLSRSILKHIQKGNDPDLDFLKKEGLEDGNKKVKNGSKEHQDLCNRLKKLSQKEMNKFSENSSMIPNRLPQIKIHKVEQNKKSLIKKL